MSFAIPHDMTHDMTYDIACLTWGNIDLREHRPGPEGTSGTHRRKRSTLCSAKLNILKVYLSGLLRDRVACLRAFQRKIIT